MLNYFGEPSQQIIHSIPSVMFWGQVYRKGICCSQRAHQIPSDAVPPNNSGTPFGANKWATQGQICNFVSYFVLWLKLLLLNLITHLICQAWLFPKVKPILRMKTCHHWKWDTLKTIPKKVLNNASITKVKYNLKKSLKEQHSLGCMQTRHEVRIWGGRGRKGLRLKIPHL